MTIGEKIKELRDERGITTKQLAKRAGVLEDNIIKYESGEVCPSKRTMCKLAKAFKVNVNVLIAAKCYPLISAKELRKDVEKSIASSMTREQLIGSVMAKDSNNSIPHVFANWLTMLREIDELSIEELADAVGLSWEEISEYESGQTIPDIAAFSKLSDFFNVSADVLLGKSELSESDRRFTEFVYRIQTLEWLNKSGKLPDDLYELCRKSVVDEFV